MNTLNFLDANVWLALLWSRHVHSETAASWFERAGAEQFLFCRFTQITVLRLLTTEKIMGKDAKTMSEAWSLWDRIWGTAGLCFSPSRKTLRRSSARARGCPLDLPKFGPMLIFWPSPRSQT
jgi:predicted nucleic acid-binding protein